MTSNVQKKVNVYTTDGRTFDMDTFSDSTYTGVKTEEYPDRIVTREFSFNIDRLVGYEFITIEKKPKDDTKKEEEDKCNHLYMEINNNRIRCLYCGDVRDR